MINKEVATKYVKQVAEQFTADPSKLEPTERKLFRKYKESEAHCRDLIVKCEDLQKQIKMAQDTLRNTELSLESEHGKGIGYLDALVELKFEPELTTPAVAENVEPVAPIHAVS